MEPTLFSPFLDDSHRTFAKACRRFAEEEIRPHATSWEEAEEFPRELYPKAAAAGMLGPLLPAEYGGGGGDLFHAFVQIEELLRGGSTGVLAGLSSLSIALPPVVALGTEEQKQRFLPPVLAGEWVAALAVTEPGAGSDVSALALKAVRTSGGYRLDGRKTFISSGVRADLVTVLARTGDHPHEGLTFFVVERDRPGYSVSRPLAKMGWRASDTAELAFDGCEIPEANRLGPEGSGFAALMRTFETERLCLAAYGHATAELALEEAEAYARERQAFGSRLWEFQALRHRLVEAGTDTLAAKLLNYQVASAALRGDRVTELAARAKNLSARVATEATDLAVQVFGGAGYMRESLVERLYRDARILSIGGGSSEVLAELVARGADRAWRKRGR